MRILPERRHLLLRIENEVTVKIIVDLTGWTAPKVRALLASSLGPQISGPSYGLDAVCGLEQAPSLEEIGEATRPFGLFPAPTLSMGWRSNPFDWKFDPVVTRWYRYLVNTLDRYTYVTIGSHSSESCCSLHWAGYVQYAVLLRKMQEELCRSALAELKRFKELFPVIFEARKVRIMASECAFERDAWFHRQCPEESPLRQFIVEHGIRLIFARGVWCLHENKIEHIEKYAHACSQGTRSPLHVYEFPQKGRWPFEYFGEYLKGLDAWTGFGWWQGAAQRNLSKATKFGYQGCVAYLDPNCVTPYFWEVDEVVGRG